MEDRKVLDEWGEGKCGAKIQEWEQRRSIQLQTGEPYESD